MENRNTSALLDHRESQLVRYIFNRYWSDCLLTCQNMILHRFIFTKVPVFQTIALNSYLIWIISSFLCIVEKLWRSVCLVDLQNSKWNCWMLVYISIYFLIKGDGVKTQNIHSNLCSCQHLIDFMRKRILKTYLNILMILMM